MGVDGVRKGHAGDIQCFVRLVNLRRDQCQRPATPQLKLRTETSQTLDRAISTMRTR